MGFTVSVLGVLLSSLILSKNNPSKERLLKLHGRWKTDLAKDMYIKESVDQRLSFVKSLGSCNIIISVIINAKVVLMRYNFLYCLCDVI